MLERDGKIGRKRLKHGKKETKTVTEGEKETIIEGQIENR